MHAKISVQGFKSIRDRIDLEIAPLTLLAGANSSGKSSLMQAVLLLKQTIEANYDPGPLLLNGPNVRFTSIEQILHFDQDGGRASGFTVCLEGSDKSSFETRLERSSPKQDLEVTSFHYRHSGTDYRLSPSLDSAELRALMPTELKGYQIEVQRERFWLSPVATVKKEFRMHVLPIRFRFLLDCIHIPGLRGNPERTYPLTSTGPRFPGTFENYVASLIHHWSTTGKKEKIKQLGQDLRRLGLTWKVESKKVDDISIELRVGRLVKPAKNGARDLVSIADVGFGVSQTLPVLVALLEAKKGQLVYVEQPEIHLHPRAQVEMASILVQASNRGVLVVVETHSSLLLLAIQTLVASGELSPNSVMLHWFERDDSGVTQVSSRKLDAAGRFGDWPEDFDDVSLAAQSRYLDAAEHLL